MDCLCQKGGLTAVLLAIIVIFLGSFHQALAQQGKGYFNSTSNATVDAVLDLQGSPGTWLSFRTCDGGEILSQTGGTGDTFTISVSPAGFVEASWTAGGILGSADVGPNYATNARWVLLKLQYTLGSVVLAVDSNSTMLASSSVNAELLTIDLSGGGGIVLGRNFVGCIEQVYGLGGGASSWYNVDWDVCPLETQQGCQPPVHNPCYTHPCKNQGVCSSNAQAPSGYTCRCTARYEGVHCQNDTGPLCNNPDYELACQNGGICQEDAIGNSTYCQCMQDFQGPLCEFNRTFTCDAETCANNGTCTVTQTGVECSCLPGFSGDNCAINIDECVVHQCLNGGVCVDGVGTYTCNCTCTGYAGDRCSEPVDECAAQPCLNGGTCLDISGSFVCICLPGWTGPVCGMDLDECSSDPCDNGGTCLNLDDAYECQCTQGFMGTNCEINVDDCASVTCPLTFDCVDGVNSYTCECPLGKVNASGSCKDYDECSSSPCANGMCLNLDNMYRCDCYLGYNGTNCDIDIDECASDPCLMNSTCNDAVNGFNCTCQPGFDGLLCDYDIDECLLEVCQNGATCVDEINSFTCNCVPGYEGELCQNDTDECAASPCQNGATCVDEINNYRCDCLPGFAGPNCSIDIDECEPGPCMNNATCQDEVNGYSCTCASDYAGDNCERYYDACLDLNPCQNGANCSTPSLPSPEYNCACAPGYNGTDCEVNIDDCLGVDCNVTSGRICFDEVDGYRCACPVGYEDPLCSVEIDECASDPCQHGGNCTDNIGNFTCRCSPGFLGERCEIDVDECASVPCENGGLCQQTDSGGFQCYCIPGFQGTFCHVTILECSSNPCLNGGTCEDGIDRFICNCAPGYKGLTCEVDINECESNPCENNSTCEDGIAEFTCNCSLGFNGTRCEFDIDECASNPCGLGTCLDAVNDYTCNCTNSGFFGSQCQNNIDDCTPDPCLNGAPCVDLINAFNCSCWEGYRGDDCGIDIDECLAEPCSNGGACLQRSNQSLYDGGHPLFPGEFSYANASGFVCECAAGFEGDRCDVDIDECASGPCANDGTCNDTVNGYTCSCAEGWQGVHCQIDIDECESGPCQNGATCTDLINGYTCTCTAEYGGSDCAVLLTGCDGNSCQNGATCVPSYDEETDSHDFTCLCDAGYTGDLCTTVTSVSFESGEYLQDPNTLDQTTLDYSLSLQTTLPDGILLFSGETDRYFLVEMFNGDLYMKYSQDGTNNNVLEISDFGQQLNDGDYHTVSVVVTGKAITVSVTVSGSSRTRRTATCAGGVCQQEVPIPAGVTVQFDAMFIGGVSGQLRPDVSRSGRFFTGCMQDIRNGGDYILPPGAMTRAAVTQPGCTRVVQCPSGNQRCNDQGVCMDLWLTYSCDCDIGYAGINCSESFVPATFRNEDVPESYAQFTADGALDSSYSAISLAFRTREPDGLLFFTQDVTGSYITVEVVNETLMVSASRNGAAIVPVIIGSDLSDGNYHSVSVRADQSQLEVTLEPRSHAEVSVTRPLAGGSSDYAVFLVGGVADFVAIAPDGAIISDAYFKGCLWDVKYNNYSLQFTPLDLPAYPIASFPVTGNLSVLLDRCQSDDTCASSPCENGGTCTVTWNDFECACPTGFGGKNCSSLTICSENPCPAGAMCKDRPDGHDCVVEATFDGATSLVTYRANISTATELDTITLRARTRNDIGIIYHSSNRVSDQFVTIYLDQGVPVVRFNLGETGEVVSQVHVDNGSWHDVEVRFSSTRIELVVDDVVAMYSGSSLASLASTITQPGSSDVFVAGTTFANNDYFPNTNHFEGCLDDVLVGGFLLPFYSRETVNSTSEEQFEATTVDVGYGCPGNPAICDTVSCQNAGTCIDVWNDAVCECVPGYTGDSCEDDINECELYGVLCALGSTCRDEINNYTCQCASGYEGRHCQIETNECDPNQCLEGSICYDGLDFFNCTCQDGYTGTLCGVLINETCAGNPCKNGATCQDQPAGSEILFECQCLPGFDGDDCGRAIDYCLGHQCLNGATCQSLGDQETYRCDCPDGYSGDMCQTDIDECTGVTCRNGATCVDEVNGYTCRCAGGYDGPFCQNDINECNPDPCKFGATCEDLINAYNCVCMPGYDGVNCSVDINECLNSSDPPCQNGGTCSNTAGGFACACPADTFGSRCQSAPCHPSPCQNRANCTARSPGVYDCLCPLGYQGVNCSLASCSSVACQNNGSCQLGGGHWECLCSQFVTGPECQYKGPCSPDLDPPCINGGTCQQTYQGDGSFIYMCQCPVGFNGTNCELEINWCDSNPCNNEGSNCTSTTETFHCSCGPGYEGTFCDVKLPDCASSLCQNGATCQDLDYGYRCQCADGYSGDDCQVDINECLGEPCQNGGDCTDAVNAFLCNCSGTGYEGSTCSEDVDECLSSPCANNATCKNSPGSFGCVCPEGWLQPVCALANPCFWEKPCKNDGVCEYSVSTDGQSVEYICKCEKDYGGDNCDRFTGTVTNWALIGGVTGGAILLLIVVIILGVSLVNVKNKRATRGTYSPSRQEISGSRVEMDNILKLPPEERLI